MSKNIIGKNKDAELQNLLFSRQQNHIVWPPLNQNKI